MKLCFKNCIDISWPISSEITEYKNGTSVVFNQFQADNVRSSVITLGSHTGTHVDAPSHFISCGDSIDQVPLQNLIGECVVLDLAHISNAITQHDLEPFEAQITRDAIVLLKTKNSNLFETGPFCTEFIYLDATGAAYLADKKVKAVGIDYLGIERNQPGHPTHKQLLESDIAIIEGLRLQNVIPGTYFFICLPIALQGLEAAPARAILAAIV